ncbi:MAG: futalosine hydrolase [Desulfovibrionaceae bacterium]
MSVLLTAATGTELVAAVPALAEHALAEHQVIDVTIGTQRWAACLTGIGPINAGIALGIALCRRPDIKGVINIGLAGSFTLTRAPLGSTIMVTEEIWPEYGLADDNGVDARGLGFPLWAPQGDGMPVWERIPLCVDAARLALPSLHHLEQGSSLTVAGVTNSTARAARLQHCYGALLENMEGFAVALACARHGVPLIELRTISNVVGSRLDKDRNFPLALRSLRNFFMSYVHNIQ